jgi:hypothetical protein
MSFRLAGVALDVALRHGQVGMPGELLHVPLHLQISGTA